MVPHTTFPVTELPPPSPHTQPFPELSPHDVERPSLSTRSITEHSDWQTRGLWWTWGGKERASDSKRSTRLWQHTALQWNSVVANAQKKKKSSVSLKPLYLTKLLEITNSKKKKKKKLLRAHSEFYLKPRLLQLSLISIKNLAINHPINFQFSLTKWISLVKPGMGETNTVNFAGS